MCIRDSPRTTRSHLPPGRNTTARGSPTYAPTKQYHSRTLIHPSLAWMHQNAPFSLKSPKTPFPTSNPLGAFDTWPAPSTTHPLLCFSSNLTLLLNQTSLMLMSTYHALSQSICLCHMAYWRALQFSEFKIICSRDWEQNSSPKTHCQA